MVHEGLVRAAGDPSPRHQLGGNAEAGAGVVVVETEHPGQVTTVAGRRTPAPSASTTTLGAWARNQAMKRATSSMPTPDQLSSAEPRSSNHSFKLTA
jgi:hypothetical protein